ncbi:MAG: hypothetical protein NTX45_17330 [Proteobacteria bacterium]|nr:hypothetical protein [Pseudomonadota bacterium]
MNANSILPTPTDEDRDDAPIWTEEDFKTAVHRVGLKPVQKSESKTNVETDSDIAVSDD